MNNERYCENVNSRLAQLVAEVRQSAGPNLHSINIHAESFFRAFLNLLFGWQLSNANAVQPNAAGIDLLYSGGNVVVQVSSTTSHEKVQSSLKKSACFLGAHFYFIAIADRLPDYKKDFQTHGLVFDHQEDILDTTRLYDRMVHHEGYGDKQAIDVQRELSELVDAYFSRQERRKKLGLRPLGQAKAKNLFEYHAEAVPLLGREADMEKLRGFVTGTPDTLFSWWAIAGPGGAGKTRLAYELQNQLLQEGVWDVSAVPSALLDRQEELLDACPGRTLLIVDYVEKHAQGLARLVEYLSDPNLDRSEPLRLLLLERDTRDKDGQIPWLDQIWGTDHHVHECFFGRPLTPLLLSPLTGQGDDDPLQELIRSFADKLCEQPDPEGGVLHPLPPGAEARLRDRLGEVDPGLLRPLFAMILTDAYVRDPETERWSREELLAHLVDREWGMLASRIAPYHGPGSLLQDSLRVLWMTATVLGAGDAPLSPEQAKDLLPQVWDKLAKAAKAHEGKLESWETPPEEVLLQRAGLLTGEQVQPLRPDLLGEYMVLNALGRSRPAERRMFLTAVLSEPGAALIFFGRVLDDYGTLLLKDPALWEGVFPEDPQIQPAQPYGRLLRDLFEQPHGSALRSRLCRCLTAFAQGQRDQTEEIAWVFNDAASVLEDTGAYREALEYFEKARKIREAALGTEHPDTAITYGNMAGVYRDMGDYPKALEYFEKARKIQETLLGTEHLDTATTYNNMAGVYQDMGDYQKALEYFEKARKIKETLLGPEHRSTAITYHNLAELYAVTGDVETALRYSDQALGVFRRILGPEHPYTRTAEELNRLLNLLNGDR